LRLHCGPANGRIRRRGDLVGSTALAARARPEELREMIAAYHRCVVSQLDVSTVSSPNTLSDGVLVYFGSPRAHELGDGVKRFTSNSSKGCHIL
jgi:class 3 adenylate cyclase